MTREDTMTKNVQSDDRNTTDHQQTAIVGTPTSDLEMLAKKSKAPTLAAYGYMLSRQRDEMGDRFDTLEIDAAQAEVVRRIYEFYADGLSPRDIAGRLNEENVPGPRGREWRESAIRGHAGRGTGILNNKSYIGGSPVSAQVHDLAAPLRIVSDELWTRVKLRQVFAARSTAGSS
jgi:hypothetical protein